MPSEQLTLVNESAAEYGCQVLYACLASHTMTAQHAKRQKVGQTATENNDIANVPEC
jgi:hypothetical protein